MADNINILIRAILEKSTKAQLETELRNIEQKLKPVNLKTNIDKISQQFKTLANGTEKLVKTTTDTTNQYGQQVRIIEKIDKNTKKLVTDTRIVTQNYKAQRIEVEKIANAYNTQFFKNFNTSIGINSVTKSAKDSASVFEDLFNKATKSTLGLTAIEKQTVKLNPALKEVTKNTGLFGQSLLDAGKKFAGWLLIGNVIMGVARQVRFGINTIVELDSAMVSLRKVTEETEESYREFYITSGEVARQLGRTKQAVINSAAEFARLGFNIKESLTLAREAMILSNVGEVSIGDATTSLISTIKGFGIAVDEEGKNIRKIIDIYNEVANNYAISQEGIAESLRKSASSLYNAGNTLEESVAMLTAANAVVQNPDMVGTAMKTVTMRLRGITDEGEEVQDLLPKLESEFNKLGITIRKNADTFKSTYDIFDSLASKWDELTDFQRANILELIAGKRQGNIISSMLGNWEDAQDSLTTALISGGSAMREFIKYMDSIEYKSGVLKSSLVNLWSEALSSGALKGIIDFGITFVDTLDYMINQTEYFKVALIAIIGIIVNRMVMAFTALQIEAVKLGTTITLMTGGLNLLVGALALATVGFGVYSIAQAKAEREKQQLIETTERNVELAESEKQAAEVLADQYNKLSKEYEKIGVKIEDTEDGKKKLDKIIEHLIKINPELEDEINSQKISYDNLSDAIQRTINKKRELSELGKQDLRKTYVDTLQEITVQKKELFNIINNYERELEAGEKIISQGNADTFTQKQVNAIRKQIKRTEQDIKGLNEEALKVNKELEKLYGDSYVPTPTPDPGDDDGSGRRDITGATTSPYASKLSLTYRDLQTAIENVSFELDKLKEKEKSLSGTDLINNLQQQNDLTAQRIELLEELNWRYGEDLPRLKIQLLELGFEYNNLESQADKYNKLSDKQKEKVDNLVKSIDDLTDSYMKNSLEILQNKNDLNDLSATIEKVTEETQKYARELGEYLINKEIESLKQLKEQIRDTYQSKIDRIQREIDRLEKRNDLLEEEETRQQKLLDISKQREKLENIKEQRNVRMFMDGQWTWVANPRQIREETTRLQDMQEEYFRWEEDLRRKNEIQKLKDQISALQTELKNEEQKYDTQIKNLQLFISEYKDRQSEFYGEQVKGLNNLMESLKDIEARSYEKRIEQLGDFVDKYNKLLNSISGMSVKPTTTTSKPTSSSGETWYIPGLGNVSTPSNPTSLPEGAIRVKHKGGFAGESSSRMPDLVNKMFNVSPNEVLVKALKNELFIPEQNIFKNFMPNMQNLISTIQPNVAGATPSNNYVVHIDKVVTEDAASFVNLLPTLAHQYKGKK